MPLHKKKFAFDNPEDSYWNQTGSPSSSIFEDLPSKQWAARAAVDNLFEGGDDRHARSSPTVNQTLAKPDLELSNTSLQARERIIDDFINNRATLYKKDLESSPPCGAPSIVSEYSASSLPSDAHRLDLDYSRLKAEHRKLQQYLETVRHDRFRALDVNETVCRLLRGAPVSLDFYRSKVEKTKLLQCALESCDSNVIFTVLIFIRNSLTNSIFTEILLNSRHAAEWYVRFLKEVRNYEELVTTLFAMGRIEEASVIELEEAIKLRDGEQRLAALRKCGNSTFSGMAEGLLVSDFIFLTECQLAIDKEGIRQNKTEIDSVLGKSANKTLHYQLTKIENQRTADLDPNRMRAVLRYSDKEAVWLQICAYVHTSRWPDLEKVLSPKNNISRGILNNNKFVCPFSWPNLFYLVFRCGGQNVPKDLICRLLRSVPDHDLRLKLAEKYEATEIVVEHLVQTRDRAKLSYYYSTLTPNSPEAFKALAALNNKGIRWKS